MAKPCAAPANPHEDVQYVAVAVATGADTSCQGAIGDERSAERAARRALGRRDIALRAKQIDRPKSTELDQVPDFPCQTGIVGFHPSNWDLRPRSQRGFRGHTDAMARTPQRTVVADLVTRGRLTESEAESITSAPRFSLPIREIISYLAGLIVLVGVVRLIAAVLEDASEIAIASVLYIVALVTGAFAWRLHERTGAWARLAEVLEIATLGAGAIAIGLTLSDLDVRGEWAALIPAALAALWGIARLRSTQFVSALTLPVSVLVVAGQVSSLVNWEDELGSIPIMIGGVVLIALGLNRMSLAFIVRGVGAVAILASSAALAGQRNGLDALLPGLVLGTAIFALGAVRMWIDLILPGGALIVLTISIFIFRKIDNDVLEGVLVVLIGLSVLAATTLVMRQGRRRAALSKS